MTRLMTGAASLACVAALSGCSIGMFDAGTAPLETVPPALVIAGHAAPDGTDIGLRYTRADDERPDVEGLQVTLRVDVLDEGIERVDLAVPSHERMSDVVAEDLDGNRAAFFTDVTFALADAEVEVVAYAQADTLEAHAKVTVADDPAL